MGSGNSGQAQNASDERGRAEGSTGFNFLFGFTGMHFLVLRCCFPLLFSFTLAKKVENHFIGHVNNYIIK